MKRRVWRWVLLAVVAIAGIAGGVFWDLKRKAAAVVARHEKAGAAKLLEIRARSWSREPMFGAELPGNRWEPFGAALDAVDLIPEADLKEIPDSEGDFKPDPERLDEIFATHRPTLDLLREACRRRKLVPHYAYEDGYSMNLPHVSKGIKAARYLAAEARRLHELGRDSEAMERAMLAIIVGHDQAFGGPLVTYLVMMMSEHRGQEAVRTILGGHALTSSQLDALAASIDRVWESRPRFSAALDVEDMTSRFALSRPVDLALLRSVRRGKAQPSRWRYLYSWDLMLPEALNEFEAFYREAAAIDLLPWRERLPRAEALSKRAEDSHNPIVTIFLPTMSRSFRTEALAQMRWTLLRTSLALARYEAAEGKLPATLDNLVPRYLRSVPECPFSGRPLSYGDGKVWSFGADGDDDGGKPPADPEDEESDGDEVWTVKRK